jgi:hypothetical protein
LRAVDHRGECRRLSGASGSGDEDQPAGFLGQPRDDGRQPQILETEDLEGDRADRHRHASALTEDVPSKARELRNGEREVELGVLLEALLLLLRQNRVGELLGVLRAELLSFESHHPTVDAQLRTLAYADVQVRGASGDHLLEQRSHADVGRLLDGQAVLVIPIRHHSSPGSR